MAQIPMQHADAYTLEDITSQVTPTLPSGVTVKKYGNTIIVIFEGVDAVPSVSYKLPYKPVYTSYSPIWNSSLTGSLGHFDTFATSTNNMRITTSAGGYGTVTFLCE